MIDANDGAVWTPPGVPANVDDWLTADQMFDARNLIEQVGRRNPGEGVTLTAEFKSGIKKVTKTAESIAAGDNWLTIDGILRHRFECWDSGATISGWGSDSTWGETRNYTPVQRTGLM